MVMIEVENWSDTKFWIITTNYVEREYLYIGISILYPPVVWPVYILHTRGLKTNILPARG